MTIEEFHQHLVDDETGPAEAWRQVTQIEDSHRLIDDLRLYTWKFWAA